MQLRVNGEWRGVEEAATLSMLLRGLSLEPRRVAVELNRRIVPRAQYDRTRLADRDELEIVTLVGGG